jgi:translation initiation factor IF-3
MGQSLEIKPSMIVDGRISRPFLFKRSVINIAYMNVPVRPDKRNNGDLVNNQIRFAQVLVIDETGKQLGVMNSYQANQLAEQAGLDLLCVAPGAKPPVCKILDYGKYRFEQQKKAKEAKKNQHIIDIKEIQISPQIGIHDLQVKVRAAIGFFEEGHKVKLVLRFKGRQMAHQEIGMDTVNKFIDAVKQVSTVEKKPELDGKLLTTFLTSTVKK